MQISLFDTPPELPALLPAPTPSAVHDQPNRRQGHLRIDSGNCCWLFLNEGGGVVRFGEMAGPTCELTTDQLRTLGDYCHRAADRIELQAGT